jgi:hypothetical protein
MRYRFTLAVKSRRSNPVPRGIGASKGCRARRPYSPHRANGKPIMYQSDITQFINQLKSQKPTLEDEQRRGRALLWDKQPVDLDERERQQKARVNQTPYVYYQNF